MLPENGNPFPNGQRPPSEADYIAHISGALRLQLGTTRAAAKTIMRWTGASDHTARNWMNGTTGPTGHHLVALAHYSDDVLAAFIEMSGRSELLLALDIHAAEVAIAKASGAMAVLRRQRSAAKRSR